MVSIELEQSSELMTGGIKWNRQVTMKIVSLVLPAELSKRFRMGRDLFGPRSLKMRLSMFAHTLLAVIILLSGSMLVGRAQQPDAAKPDRGLGGQGSFAISDVENVNLTNGNVNLSIPLASLPPIAGGKLSWSLRAIYNSKLWDMKSSQEQPDNRHSQPWTHYFDDLSDSGGWIVSGAYQLQHSLADSDVQVDCGPDKQCQQALTYRHKMIFRTPDGTTHELRPLEGHPYTGVGAQDWRRGFYADTPDTTGQAMRYYSYDGSFLWAVINPLGSQVQWTVYMPDGTSVAQFGAQASFIQQIKDTNGNKIDITSTTNLAGDVSTVCKDVQTGREIRYNFTAATNTGLVQYQKVGGAWETITVNFASKTLTGKVINAGDRVCLDWGTLLAEPFQVITSIVFPQTEPGVTRRMSFEYNSDTIETLDPPFEFRSGCGAPVELIHSASRGWGELSSMTLPSGAVAEYAYKRDGNSTVLNFLNYRLVPGNGLAEKKLTHDGVTDVWIYAINNVSGQVTAPDGLVTKQDFFSRGTEYGGGTGGTTGFEGLVYRTTQMKASNGQKMIVQESQWEMRKFNGGVDDSPGGKVAFNSVVTKEFTTLCNSSGNPSQMSAKEFQYDFNGHRTSVAEYDFFDPGAVMRDENGVPVAVPGVSAVRISTTNFHNGAPLPLSTTVYAKRLIGSATPLILNAPQETTVGASRTQFNYDGVDGMPPTKGNLTKLSKWEGTKWIHTSHTYDPVTGNRTSTTDPKLNVTRFFYDATKAKPSTVEVDPLNGSGPQTSSVVYDFWTGLATSVTDANHQTASTDYTNQLLGTSDPFGRPGVITDAQGRRVVTRYFDGNAQPNSASQVEVSTDLKQPGDSLLKNRTTIDQLGRPGKTESSEDGLGYTIVATTQYLQAGRITITSNPMRTTAASTDGSTRVTKDEQGRTVTIETFSGTGTLTGVVASSYDANTTTMIDQAGKARRSIADGLGRLVRVDEPDSAGNLGSVSAPVQPTKYSYDVLGKLTRVEQDTQPARRFVYDALSRLKQAANPENGTINYAYDDNGNLLTRTDARTVVTTLSYDGLNRVISKTYSGPGPGGTTPTVTYSYDDAAVPNSKGLLTAVTSSVSRYSYGSYDAMGRVLTGTQTTDGQSYPMSYQYNLAGAMVAETYPSGRVVVTEYDNAGRIAGVRKDASSYYAGGVAGTADAMSYTAHGATATMKLGNGRWEHTNYNSRLQPIQIGLGTSSADSSLLRLDYGYGGSSNNGNVLTQDIAIGGTTISQSYVYDSLNRLSSATETGAWTQTYDIDRYSNRAVRAGSYIPNPALTPQSANSTDFSAFDQGSNRLNPAIMSGVAYDNSGNQTSEPNQTFTYDGENRLVLYNGGNPINGATYFYDGDGNRVKTVTANGTTIFVRDIAGTLIAEYPSSALAGGGTSYFTSDTLGTPRVITNAVGGVKARHDYLPFGEEIGRSLPGYFGDNVRQKFTSKERDVETGLDYFGARYYSSMLGRFTSPDEFAGGPQEVSTRNSADSAKQALPYADITNPQSLNKYQYCLNNPLRYVDLDGHDEFDTALEEGKKRIDQAVKDGATTIVIFQAGINNSTYEGALANAVSVVGALLPDHPESQVLAVPNDFGVPGGAMGSVNERAAKVDTDLIKYAESKGIKDSNIFIVAHSDGVPTISQGLKNADSRGYEPTKYGGITLLAPATRDLQAVKDIVSHGKINLMAISSRDPALFVHHSPDYWKHNLKGTIVIDTGQAGHSAITYARELAGRMAGVGNVTMWNTIAEPRK